jgi:uncharacterized protein YcbX
MPATVMTIGTVEAIFRYPVKSMRGEALDAAPLGWHGVDGDRRLAFRRVDERGGFPWLIASKLPEIVCFTPRLPDVVTPEGAVLPALGDELAADVSRRYGATLQMMRLDHGIFDEGKVSIITSDTVREVCRLAGRAEADVRRFRPNVVIRSSTGGAPFEEDGWVGGALIFDGGGGEAEIAVTMRDLRCAMVNFDPDGGLPDPNVMKAVVRANDNHAGVYGSVTRAGKIAVGQTVTLTLTRA